MTESGRDHLDAAVAVVGGGITALCIAMIRIEPRFLLQEVRRYGDPLEG